MERTVLHVDLNNFYASVECLYDPKLRGKPVVVGGKEENRHGIVLAKNYEAKAYGIQTGNALWEARAHCPELVVVHPHYDRYLRYSQKARDIYADYTDQVEPFGLDEAWLDVTSSMKLFGTARHIADEIRGRIKRELGVTASAGIGFSKTTAKLGSDMKKPDATTEITRENFKEVVWPLPVGELLYVGRQTAKKLNNLGIQTVGELANFDPGIIQAHLGKVGRMLWHFANGRDEGMVEKTGAQAIIKSVGNSTTTPKDLVTEEDIKITIYVLAESVAARLREYGFVCSTVQVHIRDKTLFSFERQMKLSTPCADSNEIFKAAYTLVKKNRPQEPIRSLGVRGCNLIKADFTQLSFHPKVAEIQCHEAAEEAIQGLRERFGPKIIQRGIMHTDQLLSKVSPKEEHIIHPVSFLK